MKLLPELVEGTLTTKFATVVRVLPREERHCYGCHKTGAVAKSFRGLYAGACEDCIKILGDVPGKDALCCGKPFQFVAIRSDMVSTGHCSMECLEKTYPQTLFVKSSPTKELLERVEEAEQQLASIQKTSAETIAIKDKMIADLKAQNPPEECQKLAAKNTKLMNDLDKLTTEHATCAEDAADFRATIAKKERELEAQARQIEELSKDADRNVSDLRAALQKKDREIEAQAWTIKNLSQANDDKAKRLVDAAAKLKGLEMANANLGACTSIQLNADKLVADLRAALEKKDREIEAQAARIKELETTVGKQHYYTYHLKMVNDDQAKRILIQLDGETQAAAKIKGLEMANADLRAQQADGQKQLDEANAYIKRLKESLDKAEAEIKERGDSAVTWFQANGDLKAQIKKLTIAKCEEEKRLNHSIEALTEQCNAFANMDGIARNTIADLQSKIKEPRRVTDADLRELPLERLQAAYADKLWDKHKGSGISDILVQQDLRKLIRLRDAETTTHTFAATHGMTPAIGWGPSRDAFTQSPEEALCLAKSCNYRQVFVNVQNNWVDGFYFWN